MSATRINRRSSGLAKITAALVGAFAVVGLNAGANAATPFEVSAAVPWSDTGIDIVAGQTLQITASGLVCFGGCGRTVNPDGVGDNGARDGTQMFPGTVLPDAIGLSLIGKIGGTTAVGTGTPVPEGVTGKGPGFVGSSYSQIVPFSGRLFLGFNDDFFGDNSGHFSAEIELSDATPPDITITTPPDGASYTVGSTIYADYSCADAGGSGLATCSGPVADGAPIDTGTVGANTFTVNATDNAGNMSSLSHNYTVVYDFEGFFSPINNLPVVNSVKAGAAVPVKFSLNGDQGLGVFAAGYPKSQEIACDTTAPIDGVEETVTAGSSVLAYDALLDQYEYVWKSNKAWAGTCRHVMVMLIDGTSYSANFELK